MHNEIITGDCFEELNRLDEDSVHAVVTDPPYGLNFMGRDWDNFRRRNNDADANRDNVGGRLSKKAPASGAETDSKRYQEWCERWATECLRVLKPGGHLLAFSGNRTHHRLMSGIEDAGYEIRDTITWHYGSGFPKSLDVSKSIDKQAEADREVVGEKDVGPDMTGGNYSHDEGDRAIQQITKPATEQAKQWDGFKSALKPATEFVCVARSPLAEGTIAENVVAHGTGALNIDATRIETGDIETQTYQRNDSRSGELYIGGDDGSEHGDEVITSATSQGRYPSNVVFDAQQADVLDDEVGELDAGAHTTVSENDAVNTYSDQKRQTPESRTETDSGGPSRYFYTSKASKAERTLDGKIDNAHPTVKPIDLMEWLVTLATAEEQIVLDPFAGSGTTCKAAKNKHRQFIGIEQQAKWADVARVRSGLPPDDHTHIRSDDAQQGFEAYQ